ncbi:MAG: SMC-Scp complex subunit ScpB [Nanobdellota archaeon]
MPAAGSKTIKEIDEAKEKDDLKTLEAVFFISGRFLSMQELISLSDLNPIIIGDLIERLKDKYNKEDSAIEIIEKGGMWKMDVRQEYSHIINKLATGSSEFTKAEQETLAIIAYKHPIKQSVIIKIRGNKAYDHIKKFVDLGLIKRKKIGHTHELSLSEDFYDYFSISESERKSDSGLNKEIDREIEEAEKEVEEEEAEGRFEDVAEDIVKEETEEKLEDEEDAIKEDRGAVDKREKFSSREINEENENGEEEDKEEYTKGVLSKGYNHSDDEQEENNDEEKENLEEEDAINELREIAEPGNRKKKSGK